MKVQELGQTLRMMRLSIHPFILHHFTHSVVLPSYEEVSTDKAAFAAMTRMIHEETNPYNARRLVQYHGREAVVVNPPAWPLDAGGDRPRLRPAVHAAAAPELRPAADSGVRGGEGLDPDHARLFRRLRVLLDHGPRGPHHPEPQRGVDSGGNRPHGREPDFSGTISDLGGPTANMYGMNCSQPEVREKCRRLSCLLPTICPLLATDHGPLIDCSKAARRQPGVKQALVASGIRMDLALRSPEYIRQVAQHHTGGLLKVAPEHCRSRGVAADAQAADRDSSRRSPGSSSRKPPRPARRSFSCRISSPAIRAATCGR